MLKKRVIGLVLIKNDIVVQSIEFKRYLPIGKPEVAIQYLNRWGVDEIVVLNIDGPKNGRPLDCNQISALAKHCQVPLSVGGGIRTLDQVKKIIRAGADKVILNSGVVTNPALVRDSGALYGQQSVVISIDSKRLDNGNYGVYTEGGQHDTGLLVSDFSRYIQEEGAGEILLTSIRNDGRKEGYDLDLIQSVTSQVSIPVIIAGGAGHPQHACDALQAGADAIAVGNLFHFTEHSVTIFKKYLKTKGQVIRVDSCVTYQHHLLDQQARIIKASDDRLQALRFQIIEEEVI